MSAGQCATQDELLGWWLGELAAGEEARLDEHLFACARCAARLDALLRLGEGIRNAVRGGELAFVVPPDFIRRLQAAGLAVREYAMGPGGAVNCTIAPQDDLVVAHLAAPLGEVTRLDLLIEDEVQGRLRLADVPFDAARGELCVVPSARFLRTLRHAQQRLRMVAVEPGGERPIAHYTFNHHPYEAT